jgi:hypothetical protein
MVFLVGLLVASGHIALVSGACVSNKRTGAVVKPFELKERELAMSYGIT